MENYITVEQLINMFRSLDDLTTYELYEINKFNGVYRMMEVIVDYATLFAKKYHRLKVVRFKYYDYDNMVSIEVESLTDYKESEGYNNENI